MQGILIWVFVAGAFWDFVTSLLGIVGILGVTDLKIESSGVYITSIIGSFIILGLSLNAEDIWSEYADDNYRLLRPVHVVTTFFDAYTSYLGTAQNLLLRDSRTAFLTVGFSEVWNQTNVEQKIILLFVTMLVVISPIALSKFRK